MKGVTLLTNAPTQCYIVVVMVKSLPTHTHTHTRPLPSHKLHESYMRVKTTVNNIKFFLLTPGRL